ncbi:hypothetical protein AAG570_003001 [Ranatra chinensis]|uniref:MORN repeat-containing protein 5 n=1 Tax=Ranatra chinensis TaxID=642074 RepID=A0ABD0Y7P4_9HEMI
MNYDQDSRADDGGVVFEGSMKEGMLDGEGTLFYPNRAILRGYWVNGVMLNPRYTFNDKLKFIPNNWDYCIYPDRRFYTERLNGLRARPQLANDHPAREIPKGCYDTVEGFYSPRTKYLYHPLTGEIIRIVKPADEKWIMKYCRKASDENVTLESTDVLYKKQRGNRRVWPHPNPANEAELMTTPRSTSETAGRPRGIGQSSSCRPLSSVEKINFLTNTLSTVVEENRHKSGQYTHPEPYSTNLFPGQCQPKCPEVSLKAIIEEVYFSGKRRKILSPQAYVS